VILGGACLLAASACVGLVRDEGGDVPERAVIRGDAKEPLLVQESVQPVPSSGLIDER
jgi:hypothetical protein